MIAYTVTTTYADADADSARAAGRRLVEDGLVACAQVSGPIHSVYRWQGAIEAHEEHVLTLKTADDVLDRVMAAIKSDHPYENPEILATAAAAGSPEYLDWIEAQTRS